MTLVVGIPKSGDSGVLYEKTQKEPYMSDQQILLPACKGTGIRDLAAVVVRAPSCEVPVLFWAA